MQTTARGSLSGDALGAASPHKPLIQPAHAESLSWAAWAPEVAVTVGLALPTVAGEWPLLNGRIVGGLDSLSQFYPWYEMVGANLREGRLPGWNPYSFAGAPLAANPLSGWTYLPAMLAFTLLPLTPAVMAYQLAHVLIATFGVYGLGRVLGLGQLGAALAAVAYGQGGLIAVEAACCLAFASVGAWLPILLLGSAVAIRARGWRPRVRGWSLAGLALSQILASWPGQGSYYALLVLGSFVGFATFVATPSPGRRPAKSPRSCPAGRPRTVILSAAKELTARSSVGCELLRRGPEIGPVVGWIVRGAVHVGAPVVVGASLAAAGLLPRAELQALSSLAGGYRPEDLHVGGWTPPEWVQLVEPGYWYAGLPVVGLALLAPFVARRWTPTWYLLGLGAVLLALALPGPNAIHDLFGVLPGFDRLHSHLPDRIVTVFMLVPALLAGATLDPLARRRLGLVVAILLIGLSFADLRLARENTFAGYAGAEGVHRLFTVDLDAYYASPPAARFLQERFRLAGPFRYLGYGPDPGGLAYTQRFADPGTSRLGVNNRAVPDRLLDVQGYDAIHLARFDEYLEQSNGEAQNYHNAEVLTRGLRSPLLDLLAARYVVSPSALAGTAIDPAIMNPGLQTVFDDGETRVLENTEAFPWAWIVHDARAATAAMARELLDRGHVDPRQTVLLEPPLLAWGRHSSFAPDTLAPDASAPASVASNVTVLAFEADRLRLRTSSERDGILVLSEVAYPGWQATLDGEQVSIFVANGLLRAVSLPAGDHVVELRFASRTLWLGVIMSAISLAAVGLICAASLIPSSAARRFGPRIGSTLPP